MTLADLDAKSLYNVVMLDPDLVEKFIAENKALNEIYGKTIDTVIDLYHRLERMEESRDELLEALKEVEKVPTHEIDFQSILSVIREAEALKTKETK